MPVTIWDAHDKSIQQIAEFFLSEAGSARAGKHKEYNKASAPFNFLPSSVLQHVLIFAGWFSGNLGLDLKPLSINADKMGHVVISNIGLLKFQQGFAPLVPFMPLCLISTLNAIDLRACVDQATDKLVVRECMNVVTINDSRHMDNSVGFKISTASKDFFENPDSFDVTKYEEILPKM